MTKKTLWAATVGAWMTCAVFGADVAPGRLQKLPDRPVDLTRDKNLYVVGYAHLDTQWRWTYPQVIREFVGNTLHDNFALFEKYPNYLFNFSGSRRYEMMQEYYPAEFARVKDYVRAGRWFPAGSSVDEADAIVPSGESFLRQILYGNEYFRREFGFASEEFMLPDCFGFPHALPSLLAHAGIKGFSTQKLTWGSAVGIPFKVGVWQGPDGRSVVAALDPGAYTSPVKEDLSRSEAWLTRINHTGQTSGAYVDYHYYGAAGDRGGAPPDDSVKWIERALISDGPVRVISSRAEQMFKDLRPEQIARLPRYDGELLLTGHSAGSITSQAYMKRWNRKNELLADATERASIAAMWLGGAPYPADKLHHAWDLLLGSQMHDMLPGTSLPKAYEYCWNDEILAANQFAAACLEGVGVVAGALDTRGDGVPLIVFNPLSTAREDVVEAKVVFPSAAPTAVVVAAPDGHLIPAQVLAREGNTARIAFVASLPSVGFATFDVRAAPAAGNADSTRLQVSPTGLENEHYRVVISSDGDVSSIYDKTARRELLAAPARLAFQSEKSLEYPAWNMEWIDRQKPPRAYVDGAARIRVVENGPVRVAVEIEREAQGSRFVQTVRLAAGGAGDRVEFATQIDWQTVEASLKAAFPLTVANALATYDSQLGTERRGNNEPKKFEVPQHQWFDLTAPDNRFGVAVLNDSKYGSDKPSDNTLRLTLLFTPGATWRFQDQASQDFGRHDMLYAVTSHDGDWRAGQVPWIAARLNQPLLAFQASPHAGPLGRSLSLFRVSDRAVTLAAIKKAEQSDEIIVRLQELTGARAADVRVASAASVTAAREVDAQERPIGSANLENGVLRFDIGGYGLKSFALRLAPPPERVAPVVSRVVPLEFNEDVVSTNAHRTDGRLDAAGDTLAAEQLPEKIVSEGIEFHIGPTADGRKNAVAAHGQSVALPPGDQARVYLLAAADGDTAARFLVDGRAVDLSLQNWTGYIGQWDNRLWAGDVPELTYFWFNKLAGLEPGYTKRDTVAWYSSHRHTPAGDDFYRYSYLFKYRIDLPAGAKTLTLPDNPKVHVFAVSVVSAAHDDIMPATPLYDQLDDRAALAPAVHPAGGNDRDAVRVTITPPLYWRAGGLRYTTDGSTPTLASPTYRGPITLSRSATVTACEFDGSGKPGPLVQEHFDIDDVTPPAVVGAFAASTHHVLRLDFSEPLEQTSAETVRNYDFGPAIHATNATLSADGRSVSLLLSAAVVPNQQVQVSGVHDASPAQNALRPQAVAIDVATPVFVHAALAAGESAEINAPQLPVKQGQSWTMNVFVRADGPLDNRTVIAGFGRIDDKVDATGRYFSKFANGVHLWMSKKSDLESTTPLAWNQWRMLSATYDGSILRLYVNGRQVSWMEIRLHEDQPVVRLAPLDPWDHERRFNGELREFAVWDRVLSPGALELLAAHGMPK